MGRMSRTLGPPRMRGRNYDARLPPARQNPRARQHAAGAKAGAARVVAATRQASPTGAGGAVSRLSPPCRYVYVIGPETGLQKIGIAIDPRARLAALQTASPFRLKIHVAVAVPFGVAHDVERRAHRRLKAARASGEWFNVGPVDAIKVVEAAAAELLSTSDQPPPLPLFDFQQSAATGSADSRPVPTTSFRMGLACFWRAARRGVAAG
jgi:hypothetical protein